MNIGSSTHTTNFAHAKHIFHGHTGVIVQSTAYRYVGPKWAVVNVRVCVGQIVVDLRMYAYFYCAHVHK